MQVTHTVEEIMTKGTLLTCNPDTSIDDGTFLLLIRINFIQGIICMDRLMYRIHVKMVWDERSAIFSVQLWKCWWKIM